MPGLGIVDLGAMVHKVSDLETIGRRTTGHAKTIDPWTTDRATMNTATTDRAAKLKLLSYEPDWAILAPDTSHASSVLLCVSAMDESERSLLVLPAPHSSMFFLELCSCSSFAPFQML